MTSDDNTSGSSIAYADLQVNLYAKGWQSHGQLDQGEVQFDEVLEAGVPLGQWTFLIGEVIANANSRAAIEMNTVQSASGTDYRAQADPPAP